jgi:hypothetical protein
MIAAASAAENRRLTRRVLRIKKKAFDTGKSKLLYMAPALEPESCMKIMGIKLKNPGPVDPALDSPHRGVTPIRWYLFPIIPLRHPLDELASWL